MNNENILTIGVTIMFILMGAFVGSMITAHCMDNSYREMLCQNFYSKRKII